MAIKAVLLWHFLVHQQLMMAAALHVLVIGGSGLQGAPTVRQLVEAGHGVAVCSRGNKNGTGTGGRRPPLPDNGVASIALDRDRDGAALKTAIVGGGFDAVVDYCAMKPRHVEDVVAAFEDPGAKLSHYVFVSTNMVYPGGPGGYDISALEPTVTEDTADIAGASAAQDDYGGLKLKCEAALAAAYERCGFPYTTLRPPSVIGPACDNRHERLQRIAMGLPPLPPHRRKREFARRRGGFRLAYSEDMASACVRTLAVGAGAVNEAINIAMAETVTVEEYVDAVRSALESSDTSGLAVSAAEAAAALERLGAEVTNYENQNAVDTSKAQQLLGWAPTPFAECISATTSWHTPLLLQPSEEL